MCTQPFCTLPNRSSKSLASGVITQYARLDLSATIMEGMKRACKSRGASISYMVGAIISLATFRNSTNQSSAKAVIMPLVPTDSRYCLPEHQRRRISSNTTSFSGPVICQASLLAVACLSCFSVTLRFIYLLFPYRFESYQSISATLKYDGQLSPAFWSAVDMVATQWQAMKVAPAYFLLCVVTC